MVEFDPFVKRINGITCVFSPSPRGRLWFGARGPSCDRRPGERVRDMAPPPLPEGVSEVHAPSLQLLGIVRGHVGKFSEDVQVRGVSC